jgi:membrane protease YdiL (CAAX protease family)
MSDKKRKDTAIMLSILLHLILPIFFYTAITTALVLYFHLESLEATVFSALLVFPVLCYFYLADRKRRKNPVFPSFKFPGSFVSLAYILILGAALCVLGNYLVETLGLMESSTAYKEVEKVFYSPALPIQFLALGFFIPLVEELIFRGLGFAAFREKLSFWLSAFLSAALFGLYHGNLPQGAYAFFVGVAAAWLYEITGTLLAPCLFHVSANLFSLCATNIEYLNSLFRTEWKPAFVAVSASVSILCAIRIYQKHIGDCETH